MYGEELIEVYSNAHLYVSTSDLEGLPLTLLEAMSYGIPALVSPIPPHVEVVGESEEYGYLFDENEVASIQEKLQIILNTNEDELCQTGLKGQEKLKLSIIGKLSLKNMT